ncbi:MAG: SlyX family protein [Proteobacteria bacterium]|nr:SlyX family protein [Pseudomonadota bacterium]
MNELPAEAMERLIDLESRIAFIERSLIEMSDALADARMESVRDRLRIENLLSDLGELRSLLPGEAQDEPPPPHY